MPAQLCAASPRVVVEITPKAEKLLDAGLTRRLIQLELAELDLPPRPAGPWRGSATTVFFRVLAPGFDRIHVELWDRGEFHGARRVSGIGSAELRARRIALSASELARRLRQKRVAERRRIDHEQTAELAELERQARESRPEGLVLDSEVFGGFLTEGAWLVGPRLGADLRLRGGARAGLVASALGGALTEPHGSPTWRAFAVGIRAGQTLRLGPKTDLAVGASAEAFALHINGVSQVDDLAGQAASWSSRAALVTRLETKLGAKTWFHVGPDVSVLLRRVPVQDLGGERHRVGGLMLGLGVGVTLAP